MSENLDIIFENEDYLVINKRAGLITEVNPFEHPTVESLVHDYLSKNKKKPFVGIVHRLDRVTSGVMIFAKKKSILKQLNSFFEFKKVQKTYWAIVVQSPPEQSGTLHHFLRKDQKNKRAEIFTSAQKEAKACTLHYKLLKEAEGNYLLEVMPESGKFHQIRAQLAFIGCPIIGDEKYGSESKYKPLSICLHARTLTFPDLIKKGKTVSYMADSPAETHWNLFQD